MVNVLKLVMQVDANFEDLNPNNLSTGFLIKKRGTDFSAAKADLIQLFYGPY